MTSSSDRLLGPRGWSAALLVLVGVVIAWATLSFAGWQQQRQWPSAAAPFAFNRVLLIHLICVLPLAIWIARAACGVLRGGHWPILFAVLGFGGCLVSVIAAPSIRELTATATSIERYLVRLVWSWLILLPWCAAAVTWFAVASSTSHQAKIVSTRNYWMDGLISLLFACLPIVQVQQVIGRQSALFADAVVNQRYNEALQIVERLHELGAERLVERPTGEIVGELRARIAALKGSVEVELPKDATDDLRLERASQLYGLGRFDEVRRVLGEASPDPRVHLRLAVTDEAERDYRRAAEGYQQTIDALSKFETLDDDQLRILRIAFERRVNNLRRIGENRRAEAELIEALNRWPQVRDALLLQLGFHYQMAGRTSEAVGYFQQAAQENPRLQPQADAALARWQHQAEGCLLRTTRGATR